MIRRGGCWRSGGWTRTVPAIGSYQRTTDFRVSPTDPDATPMWTSAGTALGYHDHYVVDGGKRRIILAALVTPADVMENMPHARPAVAGLLPAEDLAPAR